MFLWSPNWRLILFACVTTALCLYLAKKEMQDIWKFILYKICVFKVSICAVSNINLIVKHISGERNVHAFYLIGIFL